jgi:catechol 2,3-dioxygenase-like lactoylglutathione lyase family enzyme
MADPMTEPGVVATDAPVTGFSHVQLLVSDVAASERWYTTVLGLDRFAADDTEGYVALRHRPSKMVIVLTRQDGDVVPGGRLDHLAFAVPDGASLERWAEQLTALGIDHAGVVLELGKPSLQLLDPDGVEVELVAPPARHD